MKRPMIEDVSMIGVGVSLSPELGPMSVTVVAVEFVSSVKSTKLRTKYTLTMNESGHNIYIFNIHIYL